MLDFPLEKGEKVGVRSGAEIVSGLDSEGVNVLESYEAHRGTVVRVREGHWNGEFAGMRGTIQESWVSVAHGAVDVRLEDGSLRLFWLDDLSVVDEDIAV